MRGVSCATASSEVAFQKKFRKAWLRLRRAISVRPLRAMISHDSSDISSSSASSVLPTLHRCLRWEVDKPSVVSAFTFISLQFEGNPGMRAQPVARPFSVGGGSGPAHALERGLVEPREAAGEQQLQLARHAVDADEDAHHHRAGRLGVAAEARGQTGAGGSRYWIAEAGSSRERHRAGAEAGGAGGATTTTTGSGGAGGARFGRRLGGRDWPRSRRGRGHGGDQRTRAAALSS